VRQRGGPALPAWHSALGIWAALPALSRQLPGHEASRRLRATKNEHGRPSWIGSSRSNTTSNPN